MENDSSPQFPALSSSDPERDLHLLGIDPEVSYFDLNLAGSDLPVARPEQLAAMQAVRPTSEVHAPTFSGQNYAVPPLKPFDLSGVGLDAIAPFEPDPQCGDLLRFSQPLGIEIHAATSNPLQADPTLPELKDDRQPEDLSAAGVELLDPLHPVLQRPEVSLAVSMQERPAELSPAAMDILHEAPTYEQLPARQYDDLWMAQAGNNTARERHLGMLMLGLDSEEKR